MRDKSEFITYTAERKEITIIVLAFRFQKKEQNDMENIWIKR
jgi:hypothetical protein